MTTREHGCAEWSLNGAPYRLATRHRPLCPPPQHAADIGICGGREANQFYRRVAGGRIESHVGKTITPSDVIILGPDVVHSIANPTREWTAALHVYGGEFFTTPRTMWN